MAPTIAIIAAGAMGAGVASRLTSGGCTVLTNLDCRSEVSCKRAYEAGMRDVPFVELTYSAHFFLSILPPSEAEALAKRYLKTWNSLDTKPEPPPIYVDCNAVSPKTTKEISSLFEGSDIHFVDAGIIGGPPRDGYNPTFYASADKDELPSLDEFSKLSEYGIVIKALAGEGAGVGDASALKMSYAGISKGLTGLLTTMILSAHAASPSTAEALLRELRHSQPQLLKRLTVGIPSMLPKAYRWVGEMHEISDFVGGPLGDIHKGMAALYGRIETAVDEDGEDKRVLEQLVRDAKELLEANETDQAAGPLEASVSSSALYSS